MRLSAGKGRSLLTRGLDIEPFFFYFLPLKSNRSTKRPGTAFGNGRKFRARLNGVFTPDLPSGITMIELIKRVALKAAPLSITFPAMLFIPLASAWAAVMGALRIGENPGFMRLVMKFDRFPSPPPLLSVDRNRLRIDLKTIATIHGGTRCRSHRIQKSRPSIQEYANL